MRRVLRLLLGGVLTAATACGGTMAFECEGVEARITEVAVSDGFRLADGSWDEARPGYLLVQVVVEPPGGRNLGLFWCEPALTDGRGAQYQPYSRTWQLVGGGEYVWTFEVPDGASGLRLSLPDGTHVDLGR